MFPDRVLTRTRTFFLRLLPVLRICDSSYLPHSNGLFQPNKEERIPFLSAR